MKIPGETSRPSPLTAPTLDLAGRGRRGVWVDVPHPASLELIAAEGPDWVCIDGQHGHPDFPDMLGLIDAANVFGVPAMVRVQGHELGGAGRVIDAGAQGLIFPTVEDGETAELLVRACRFSPRGSRSYGPVRRAPRYAKATPGVLADDPLAILMVETRAGYENLDAILAAGPDAIFVGPYDLSLSLGVDFDSFLAADPDGVLRDIAKRCADAGVSAGIYTGSPALSEAPISWGYSFMPIASDFSLISTAARAVLEEASVPA
ncbi:HpcH/HpaI aldolase/citrate lyase family protein [Paenarthrobacter sp. NPDC090522]|uniref:HpcH/HpaI aldolase family protein n=1 Tax=Paenarthrobacter sp. NPDC090522 TaxID=3364383 RepID=UPI0038178EC9